MFITFFFIVNTNSFQDYIRGNIISYVNYNTDNNIEISDSRYNLKGELIISNVLLSDKNSDTIFNLESLSTKYIPLISNNQYYSSLKIEGLKIYLNQGDKDIDCWRFLTPFPAFNTCKLNPRMRRADLLVLNVPSKLI